MSKKPVKKAEVVKDENEFVNADFVGLISEKYLLSNVIHGLGASYNPAIVEDLEGTPKEIANAKRWWKKMKPITDALFQNHLKLEKLVEEMRKDEKK